MRANLGALFQHHDRQVRIKLFQTDGGRQTSRASPHDHNVIFHLFAHDILRHGYPSGSRFCLARLCPKAGQTSTLTQHPNLAWQGWRNYLSLVRRPPAYSRHSPLQSAALSGQLGAVVAQGHGPLWSVALSFA
jgi:hypothetical protein